MPRSLPCPDVALIVYILYNLPCCARLYHYEWYEPTIARELRLAKQAIGITAVRVFLHSMVFAADGGATLIASLDDFLGKAADEGIGVGLVFFDDCWNHAGLDLGATCQPVDGAHNGCWMASPQDSEREAGLAAFEPYVKVVAGAFADDPRVLWWEVFNEPQDVDFSNQLRAAAYGWLHEVGVSAPIASCWDENEGTDLVDHHQYSVPWGGTANSVFHNNTGR